MTPLASALEGLLAVLFGLAQLTYAATGWRRK
jgi:hypothetical protein